MGPIMTEHVDVKNTLGSLLLGLLVAACLFGVVILQAYLYFRVFNKDSIITRTLIALLVSFNAVHLAFISHAVYYFVVINYGRADVVTEFRVWTLSMHVGINAVIILIVHGYYAKQIWLFSKKNILSLCFVSSIMVLSVARFAVSIGTTVSSVRLGGFGVAKEEREWIISSFATSLPSDLMITLVMTYFLRRNRRNAILSEPISKIVLLYIMHTASLPSILTSLALICYLALDDNLTFIALHLLVGELYTSSMLSMLNSRVRSHGRGIYTGSYFTAGTLVSDKAYGKSTMQSEVTFTHDMTRDDVILQPVSTDSSTKLDYRGSREFTPGTPIYKVAVGESEAHAHDPNVVYSGSMSTMTPPRCLLRALSPVQEVYDGYNEDSIRSHSSASTRTTRITGPDMSWESVCTRDMERGGYDIGDIAWDGHDLQWHVGQATRN